MKVRVLFFAAALLFAAAPAVAAAQVPRPTCILGASNGSVQVGQTVNLSWQSNNATAGNITSIGSVPLQGKQGVIPTPPSTTYVGTFTGPGGSGVCSITITVNAGNGAGGYEEGGVPAAGQNPIVPGPLNTSPTGLVPCNGIDCQACNLAQLGQRIINWLVGFSIPLAAAMFAWAGILYFTSLQNPTRVADAKQIFKNVGIGFVIVLCAWLGIQTILKAVLKPQYYQSWNSIQCVQTPNNSAGGRQLGKSIIDLLQSLPLLNKNAIQVVTGVPSYINQPGGPQLIAPPGGGCAEDYCWDANNKIIDDPKAGSIANAATLYYGQDTSAGPEGGNKACAWAVNNIVQSAGYAPIDGDSVALMEQTLQNGRGTLVGDTNNISNVSAGDIVVWKNDSISHVGIVTGFDSNKQPIVTSNTSANASFSTKTDVGFNKGVQSRIYHVNN